MREEQVEGQGAQRDDTGQSAAERDVDAEADVGEAVGELVAARLRRSTTATAPGGSVPAGRARGRSRPWRGQPDDAIALGQRERTRRAQPGGRAPVGPSALAGDRDRERHEVSGQRETQPLGGRAVAVVQRVAADQRIEQRPQAALML